MKIALLHYTAPPVVGGVESVMGHQARLMADAGHSVLIVAGRGEKTDPRIDFRPLPLADSRHPEVLSIKAGLDVGSIPESFPGLVSELEVAMENILAVCDFIVAHNVCSLHKNLALTAALWQLVKHRRAPRAILWHHDLAWTTPRYRAELHPGYPWDLLRGDWPEAIQVVVSRLRQQELSQLLGVPLDRIRVVPNGLDLQRFLNLADQTMDLVKRLDLLAASPILLLPVRITPRKNIELALQTLAALRAQLPEAALVVTGPLGPHNPANADYFRRLVDLRQELGVEDSAHFLAELVAGYLPDYVVGDLYRLADALLLPSFEEGFGIPLLEAGLAGLPIFCTDIPPLRELGGSMVHYFSPQANAREVARLIASHLSPDPVYQMRVQVRQEYTWGQIYLRHIEPLFGL